MRGKTVIGAVLFLAAALGHAEAQEDAWRPVSCLVLSEKDPGLEAGKLGFERMYLEPELGRWLPSRFKLESGRFFTEASLSLPYRLEKATLLERRAGIGLYAVQARLAGRALPRPDRRVAIVFSPEELFPFGGAIQPGQRALELAARKLGLSSGRAWLLSMERLRNGSIKAVVGFDLPE